MVSNGGAPTYIFNRAQLYDEGALCDPITHIANSSQQWNPNVMKNTGGPTEQKRK